MKIEDLKPYIGFQETKEPEDGTVKILYMKVTENGPMDINFSIERHKCEMNLSEEEAIEQIEALLDSFSDVVENETIIIERAKSQVASKSRRGFANTNYKNSWFYKGTSYSDAPIIVAHHEGKYAIFKHPNFDKYGFKIEMQ
jgi:hypothetical protein